MNSTLNIVLSILFLAGSFKNGIYTIRSDNIKQIAFPVHSKTKLYQCDPNHHQNQPLQSLRKISHGVINLKTKLNEPVYVSGFFTKGEVLIITTLHATGETGIAIGLILGKMCSEKMCEVFPDWTNNVFVKTLPYVSMVSATSMFSATSTVEEELSQKIVAVLAIALRQD